MRWMVLDERLRTSEREFGVPTDPGAVNAYAMLGHMFNRLGAIATFEILQRLNTPVEESRILVKGDPAKASSNVAGV